jgi:ABC-2 type transport system ATP-binding protein
VPQDFALFGELTPMENLWYIGELFGMSKSEIRERSEKLLKTVGLFDKRDVPAEGFSGGMKQRLSVAAGLLHMPDILFMDEPTTGLDPQSRIALRQLTRELNESGITIIYTTHDMEEADKLCNRIAVIDHGRIMAEGTPNELKERYGGGQKIEIEVDNYDEKLVGELKRIAGAKSVKKRDGIIELHLDSVKVGVVPKLSAFLAKRRVNVREIRAMYPSLEDVFINLTEKGEA